MQSDAQNNLWTILYKINRDDMAMSLHNELKRIFQQIELCKVSFPFVREIYYR